MKDIDFTAELYGNDFFRYSIDTPRLPKGFIAYHKANFTRYFKIQKKEFRAKKILETGCGPGKHAVVLGLMGADVTAVDLSDENIKRARKLKELYRLDNLEFIQHDLMMPFTSGGQYDLISAHNWLQHAEDPSVVLYNLVSILKIGGKIYLSLYHAGTFRFFIAQIARNILKRKYYSVTKTLVKYHFPNGFKEFNNPDDIYMENIFDDFFVPYCHTTTYDIVISDATKLGLRSITDKPKYANISGLDNIPLRIGFEKVKMTQKRSEILSFHKAADEFIQPCPSFIKDSIELAKKTMLYMLKIENPYIVVSFCLGLYRIRAFTSRISDAKEKHEILQAYLEMSLRNSLKDISFAHDTQKLYKTRD